MSDLKPTKIYLPRMVHGDWPIGHLLIAQPGVYDAVENRHGAIAVKLPGGEMLGVKPGEYERIQ